MSVPGTPPVPGQSSHQGQLPSAPPDGQRVSYLSLIASKDMWYGLAWALRRDLFEIFS